MVKNTITKRIKPKTKNPLLAVFLGKLVGFIIVLLGFMLFLNVIGLGGISKQILAGAGITTFVIGFAFKDIGENFLAGILLAFKSPFKENDLIETEAVIGYVKELRIRETIIKTTDGKDVFVPNSQILKSPLINYTIDGFLRNEFMMGIDYSSNLPKAIELIIESVSKTEGVLLDSKKPTVVIDEFAASTINLKVYFWLDTFKSSSKSYHLAIRTQVMKNALLTLTDNGFSLPSSIVEIKQYEG